MSPYLEPIVPDVFPTLTLTSPHAKGAAVVRLQKALARRGFNPGPFDGELGVLTATAVRAARYRFGYPLRQVVAVADARLVGLLEGTERQTLAERAVALARRRSSASVDADAKFRARLIAVERGEDGVKEDPAGSNDGARVRVYQKVTGAYRQAWCASFQCWALRQAGYLGALPTYPAYCPSWEAKAAAGTDGWHVVPPHQMRVGDHVLYDFGDGEAQHIGLCASVPDGSGQFEAWEGNTSTSSDDNGGAVMLRTRNLRSVRRVVRVPAPKR